MKKALLFVFSLLSFCASAQDTIVKQNKEKEIGKIIEVRADEVVYKKIDRPDGPNYTLPKNQVAAIHYADGHSDSFAQVEEVSGESGRSLAETKEYIIAIINEFGSEYGFVGRRYRASFEGEFLHLITMNDKNTAPKGPGVLYDFTIVEKFYRISYRDNNVGVLDIKVARVADKKTMTTRIEKLTISVQDQEAARQLRLALVHLSELQKKAKPKVEKF